MNHHCFLPPYLVLGQAWQQGGCSGVSLHVYLHIVLAGETLSAKTTLIRFLSSVDLHVLSQLAGLWEASTTMFTLEIVHPCVSSFMDYQVISPSETLITVGALVRSFSCVASNMNLQLATCKTLLSTEVTFEYLALAMHHLPMVLQTS